MSKRRVVVTGLGAVTPVGLTVKESWENIVAGKSGVAPLTLFDVSDFTVRFGASVKNFDVTSVIPKKDAKKMDTFIHYGIAAAKEAIEDAGLVITDENAERIGVAIGSGIGGLPGIEAGYDSYLNGGPRKISPFFVPSNIINMISGNLSIMYGMKGRRRRWGITLDGSMNNLCPSRRILASSTTSSAPIQPGSKKST